MSTATARKIILPKPLRLILSRVKKLESFTSILKTAGATGYLTDGMGLTVQITPEEVNEIKKLKPKGFKAAKALPNPGRKLPEQVGLMVSKVEEKGQKVILHLPGGITVKADPVLMVLMDRYPNTTLHLGMEDKDNEGPVFLATRSEVVASCPLVTTKK